MVGGDPAILNDCGNQLRTASMTMDGGRTSMAQLQRGSRDIDSAMNSTGGGGGGGGHRRTAV